jgi:hypothetical protein
MKRGQRIRKREEALLSLKTKLLEVLKMELLALGCLFLAIVTAFWQWKKPVLIPGEETVSFKPVVVVVLLALALICYLAGGSGGAKDRGTGTATPVQNSR